jgi:hypothetical protein
MQMASLNHRFKITDSVINQIHHATLIQSAAAPLGFNFAINMQPWRGSS